MPTTKTETKFYQYRRLYTEEQAKSPYFEEMKRLDRKALIDALPEDCSMELPYTYFEYPVHHGICVHHFENMDELMMYKSIILKDRSIWTKYKEENRVRHAESSPASS